VLVRLCSRMCAVRDWHRGLACRGLSHWHLAVWLSALSRGLARVRVACGESCELGHGVKRAVLCVSCWKLGGGRVNRMGV